MNYHTHTIKKGESEALDKIRAEIEQLPITDTAVRLVTEVIDKYKAESEGEVMTYFSLYKYHCRKCNLFFRTKYYKCPNCGAKMDEV